MNAHELDQAIRASFAAMTPEEKQRNSARDSALAVVREQVVAKSAIENFGIAPGHSDAMSAAHPALAGIIRRAVREAFNEGVEAVSLVLVMELAAARKEEQKG